MQLDLFNDRIKKTERMMVVNRDIRIIALDMDGTLLNHHEEISEENKRAIKLARQLDIQIVISTGRPFQQIERYVDELNLDSFFVTVNGGEIRDGSGKLLERHLLKYDYVERLWDLVNIHKVKYWAVTVDRLFRNNIPPNINIMNYQWLKFGYDIPDMKIRKMVLQELKNYKLEVTNSSPTNIEVNPFGINKGFALEKICSQCGLKMENVMAIGDSLNDMSMITKAGYGVAMGNAQDIVKKSADWITGSNDENGVAEAILKVIENR